MLYSGLASVTFRSLQPAEIVRLVADAGLAAVEWGGDIHVPHGEVKKAGEVYERTVDAGLKVASYGSYYIAGESPFNGLPFEKVLETALELHAPNIRVWAGKAGSAVADGAYRSRVAEDSRSICDAALKEGISISFEYHGGSLTDTPESACRLLDDIGCSNVYTYWQPTVSLGVEERFASLKQVAPKMSNLHVFQWQDDVRLPLAEGAAEWEKYLKYAGGLDGDRYCLLEFVREDAPARFMEDAAVLLKLLQLR